MEDRDLILQGQLPAVELDIDSRDEMIQMTEPLEYRFEVQEMEGGILVRGHLSLLLACRCVRCLKPFKYRLEVPDYSVHLPLTGEEAVKVVNDCVDLTGQVREDILLEFPQHPLCDQECKGLPWASVRRPEDKSSDQTKPESSAWAELNKLKL